VDKFKTILTSFFPALSQLNPFYLGVAAVNVLLFIFARRLLKAFHHESVPDEQLDLRVKIFRIINLSIFIICLYSSSIAPGEDRGLVATGLGVLATIYAAYLSIHLLDYFIQIKFGRRRNIEGHCIHAETYNSRLLSILCRLFAVIIALIAIVRILGFESWLEAGGVIGFIGVFLALTQSSWAPDVFSGLIILNSRLVEEGDVVEINDGVSWTGVVFRTKIFHTEILNVVNNHRVMIKNSNLREFVIHNLSKFASAKGLREVLTFNIDYKESSSLVKKMFTAAYEKICCELPASVESQYPLEISVLDAGDYAVKWGIFFYTKDVKNVIRTKHLFREMVLKTSKKHNISLATPFLGTLNLNEHPIKAEKERQSHNPADPCCI